MSRRRLATFADRLAYARALLARGTPATPLHLADQFSSASADTRALHDRVGAIMPILEPGRHWRQRMDPTPSDDTRAYLLAALLGCTASCNPPSYAYHSTVLIASAARRRYDAHRQARMIGATCAISVAW